MHKKQSGFALVESLLILIIILLVCFIGYYVWHSKDKTDKNLDAATKSSQGATQQTSVTQKFVTISDWGVKLPIPTDATDMYAAKTPDTDDSYTLSVHSLDATDDCAASKTGVAILFRAKVGTNVEDPGSPINQDDFDKSPTINGYHYLVTSGNGLCISTPTDDFNAVRAAVLGLQDRAVAL